MFVSEGANSEQAPENLHDNKISIFILCLKELLKVASCLVDMNWFNTIRDGVILLYETRESYGINAGA